MNRGIVIFYVYASGVFIVSVCVAQILERRLKARSPETLPYRWGYYVGCALLAKALLALWFASAAVSAASGKLRLFYLFLAANCCFLSICGWFIIKRRWWAWVLGTIFSFNVLLWFTNSIYGSNRRAELAKKSH